jgi:hypothetical protein
MGWCWESGYYYYYYEEEEYERYVFNIYEHRDVILHYVENKGRIDYLQLMEGVKLMIAR